MKTLPTFLTESQFLKTIDTEDLIWSDGSSGVSEVLNSFEMLIDYLKGKKITAPIIEKLDAAPTIIMGSFEYESLLFEENGQPVNPQNEPYLIINDQGYLVFDEKTGHIVKSEDPIRHSAKVVKITTRDRMKEGSFFIATRSVFAKKPKIVFAQSDIDTYYGEQPDLAHKMKQILRYAEKLKISKIVQGDLMFTDRDRKEVELNGKKSILFRTNTIIYSVPENTEFYHAIKIAKIGLYFYASYQGKFRWVAKRNSTNGKIELIVPSADWLSQVSRIDTSSFRKTKDVFFDDALLKETIKKHNKKKVSERELFAINALWDDVRDLQKKTKAFLDTLSGNKIVVNSIVEFQNFLKNKGTGSHIYNDMRVGKFERFVRDFYDKKIKTLKSKHAIQENQKTLNSILLFLETNKTLLGHVFLLFRKIDELKLSIIHNMENQNLGLDSFVQTKDGLFYEVNPSQYLVRVDQNTAIRMSDKSAKTDFHVSELEDI